MTLKRTATIVMVLANTSNICFASENAMWRFGYEWVCTHGAALTCERDTGCAFSAITVQSIEIFYKQNLVQAGTQKLKIKRHYSQKIEGSPLIDEVKIELEDNSVIWLTPVDASGTYSSFWTGMVVRPKNGVQLSVSLPAFCKPKE